MGKLQKRASVDLYIVHIELSKCSTAHKTQIKPKKHNPQTKTNKKKRKTTQTKKGAIGQSYALNEFR